MNGQPQAGETDNASSLPDEIDADALLHPDTDTEGNLEALPEPGATGEAADQPTLPGPPAIPPVIDVHDLDWDALRAAVDPGAVRRRIEATVTGMEAFLDRAAGMLFDADRANPEDRAIKLVSPMLNSPLWFVGDLHGDLLALEAALKFMRQSAARDNAPGAGIVFLGDLFDDGGYGLEVLIRVFELILEDSSRICIIAGNHDEALSFNGGRFSATVSPSDFADFLNANADDESILRLGRLTVRLAALLPRALFFPDGLLVAHGGFPLADLHPRLLESGNWNDPACLADFVWTRTHPKARRKLPNRFTRGSQYGHEDFTDFCRVASELGRPVTHMIRGHDHIEERYAIYPAYSAAPVLTTVALARRLPRENFGPYERVPTIARYVPGALPQVHRLHIPGTIIRELYPEPQISPEGARQ